MIMPESPEQPIEQPIEHSPGVSAPSLRDRALLIGATLAATGAGLLSLAGGVAYGEGVHKVNTEHMSANEHHHGSRHVAIMPGIRIPRVVEKVSNARVVERPFLKNLHPEKLTVPPEISQIMSDNTVYLTESGCSGFLIRDAESQPIGIISAQHCGLEASQGHRSVDANGNTTVGFGGEPFGVETGDNINSLTKVGNIGEFALDAPGDNTHDQVLGAFKGHSIEDVIANDPQMPPDAIAQLKTGDTIYNSGWPVNQPENSGPMERQEFAMTVLGLETITTISGLTLQVLTAAVPESKDGAECSWGNSGSVAFIPGPNGQPWIIGVASAFNDFGSLYNQGRPEVAAQVKAYYEDKFGVNLNGYAGVCSFSYLPPSTSIGGEVLAGVYSEPSYKPGPVYQPAH